MSFTPGPWSALVDPKGAWAIVADDVILADIVPSCGHEVDNAELMAAAPDLLAACESYLEANDEGIGELVQDAEDAMRRAVEKARGPKAPMPVPSWANPRDLEPDDGPGPF